ncbi:MAG: hypothetical protein JXA49_10190, partial [Actinobacteria bacterium]|nr:hypothetical protein [Actinomycetota bacterium]
MVKAKVTRQAEGKTAGNQINQTSIPFDGVPVDGPLNDPVNSSGVQRVPGPLSKSFSHAGASSLPVSYRLVNEDDAEFYEELDPSTLLAQAIVDADITSPEEDDTARDTVDVNGTAAGSWFSDFILKIKARGLLFGCHFDGDLTEFNGGPG